MYSSHQKEVTFTDQLVQNLQRFAFMEMGEPHCWHGMTVLASMYLRVAKIGRRMQKNTTKTATKNEIAAVMNGP